jgi:hypothetical protein
MTSSPDPYKQALCLLSARKAGLKVKKEAENPIYE